VWRWWVEAESAVSASAANGSGSAPSIESWQPAVTTPMHLSMALFARHLIPVAVVAVALVVTAAVFTFARPGYHPVGSGMTSFKLPAKPPAADAAGAAGWVWPGTPGWAPGYTVMDGKFNISGLQPVEVQAAQLAAARNILDASEVRVVSAIRPASRNGALAILAAPAVGATPEKTCLAAMLPGDAPVVWECPGATPTRGDLANARVLVAAAAFTWHNPGRAPEYPLYLAGVARGDVYRVVLHIPGRLPMLLYTRGTTWGEFSSASGVPHGGAYLAIYGRHRLVQKLKLDVAPGQQRVFQ